MFDNEVLPLVRELRKAVAESRALGPEEKIRLTQLVRTEIEGYARKYCSGLLRYYLSYHFHAHDHGNPVNSLHTALLDITKPGSRFVSHLSSVVENAALAGLDDPYLKPLAECLAEFRPLIKAVQPRPSQAQAFPSISSSRGRSGAEQSRRRRRRRAGDRKERHEQQRFQESSCQKRATLAKRQKIPLCPPMTSRAKDWSPILPPSQSLQKS